MVKSSGKEKQNLPSLYSRDNKCAVKSLSPEHLVIAFQNHPFFFFLSGIPCVLILIFVPLTASSLYVSNPGWFFIHFIACFAPFFASPIYHLFMCHKNGPNVYQNLLTFDVCGVWAINALGGLGGIRCTFYCFPVMKFLSLLFYITVSLLSLYFILVAKSSQDRLKPLITFGIMRYFFVGVRISLIAFSFRSNGESLPYYLSMDLLALVGGALNVARIPEKWFPGKCDLIGNSHQIMHVISVVSVICLHIGSLLDFNWMITNVCEAS